MIEEEAVVMRVGDDFILVEPPMSGCSSCTKACVPGLFRSGMKSDAGSMITPCRTLDLQEGQRVVIGVDETALAEAALQTFLWPLLLTLVGAFLGWGMAHIGNPGRANVISAGMATAFFLIAIGMNCLNLVLRPNKHRIRLLRVAD